jgi:hypothetical protein
MNPRLALDQLVADVTWNFVAVGLGMVAFGLFALPPLIRRSGYEVTRYSMEV